MTRLATKLLIKLLKSQKVHPRIVQKQLQIKQNILQLTEKYLKKDIYPQKKDSKLLMI